MTHKPCMKCKGCFDPSDFSKDRCRPDGLSSICKACSRAKDRARYAANPEKERARQAAIRNGVSAKIERPALASGHKECIGCHEVKSHVSFFRKASAGDGYMGRCKECDQAKVLAWRRANPERATLHFKACIERNPERYRMLARAASRIRYWAAPEKERARMLLNQKKNPDVFRRGSRIRSERLRKATPPWLSNQDVGEMKNSYRQAVKLTEETGTKHAVDHIFPLKGKNFSGLNVPWNMKVIPASENIRKSNRAPDDFKHIVWGL